MTVVRLTREASRARTRQLLLDAAAKVFAAQGFNGASMDGIAAEAGFTRGAVYSNFADKAELFLAVLEEREARRTVEVRAIYETSAAPAAFFANLLAAEPHRNDDAAEWLLLRLEFTLFALRNPEARAALVERNRARVADLEPAIEGVLRAVDVAPPRPIPELAQIVQSLDEGMSVLALVDPEGFRQDLFLDTLGVLLDAVAALDREQRGS